MAQSYFVWQGMDCRAMGVRLAAPVPIVWPEERVEHIQIPGRSGDLTAVEGEHIYNSYIQTAQITVIGGQRAGEVKRWLRGSGYVTFSGEPDKRQMARVIGAVTLNKVSRNLDLWRGEVQFYCQPLKERIYKETSTVSRGGAIRNTGDVAEKPLITVVNTSANFTVGVGSRGITIAAPSTGMQFKIDCDAQIVIYANDNAMELVSAGSRFPELAMGENILTGTGWASATVERRERFL